MIRSVALLVVSLVIVVLRHLQPVLREQQLVKVGSSMEQWRLEWLAPPSEACGPDDPGPTTCPCEGFAFGEMGALNLVRLRAGAPDDTLALTPLFANEENPAVASGVKAAVLQRWPVLPTDDESLPPKDRIRARSATQVMKFGDYDHDGRSTEFPLLVGSSPCGHNAAVVVGVSRTNPSLHVFTTAAHPERPLVLDKEIWRRLLQSNGIVSAVEWACGDHGADLEIDVHLQITAGVIYGQRLTYGCKERGGRARLQSREVM